MSAEEIAQVVDMVEKAFLMFDKISEIGESDVRTKRMPAVG